jgi:hypothetical protein
MAKVERKKYERISVAVSGFFKRTVTERAEAKGVSVSTYVKDLIRVDIKKP